MYLKQQNIKFWELEQNQKNFDYYHHDRALSKVMHKRYGKGKIIYCVYTYTKVEKYKMHSYKAHKQATFKNTP